MRVSTAESAVRALEAIGVTMIFGIPGVHNNPIYAALARSGIRHITTRHEQGAGFMADGYARVSGRIGVCLVTGGPGVTNAATAIGQAYSDSTPVLIISTQNERAYADKDKGCAHEAKDQRRLMEGLCAWSARAESAREVGRLIYKAAFEMTTQRPRPVHIEIPIDVLDLAEDLPPSFFAPMPQPTTAQPVRAVRGNLDDLSEALRAARSPLWLLGGGAVGARNELISVLNRYPAPVLSTVAGKGIIPDDNPLSVGCRITSPGLKDALDECDLLVAIGTMLAGQDTSQFSLTLPEKLVHIDIDPANIDRNYPATIALVGDAAVALAELDKRLALRDHDRSTEKPVVADRAARLRQSGEASMRLKVSTEALDLLAALREVLPRESVIFGDMTTVASAGMAALPVYEPRTFHFPQGYATLGFSFPAALGAKLAQPDRPMISLSGDGGFLFSAQELATAVQYGISLPVVIFNNNGYGAIRRDQAARYNDVELGVNLHNPDFVSYGLAFGARAVRADGPAALSRAVSEALCATGPTLIEVPVRC